MEKQTCHTCKTEKNLDDFHRSSYESNGRKKRCKTCVSDKARARYAADPSKSIKRSTEWAKKRVQSNRELVWEYLLGHPCIRCGETNPVVLEFDHRDPTEKVDHVSRLINSPRCAKSALMAEIAKCDVLCANCHRIKTAEQFGYWRLSMHDS